MDQAIVLSIILVLALVFLLILFHYIPFGVWIRAIASGVHVSIRSLIGMRIRHISPTRLVDPLIKANKAGLNLSITQLETHYLAGGNVDHVINALIAAQRANLPIA